MAVRASRLARRSGRHSPSEQLREIVASRGLTAHALSVLTREAGEPVNVAVIARFLNGQRTITLDTLDRIALALGLRLVELGAGRYRPRQPAPRVSLRNTERTPKPDPAPAGAPIAAQEQQRNSDVEPLPDGAAAVAQSRDGNRNEPGAGIGANRHDGLS
jgi:hypothetical protein